MANEVVITMPAELGGIEISQRAIAAFNFARKYAGKEMTDEEQADFISHRALFNLGFRDLTEIRKGLEALCKEMKEVTEHTFNVGSLEDIEDSDGVKISWGKQSYSHEWVAYGSACQVVRELSKKKVCDIDTALCELSVDAVVRASGLKKEKLIDMFPEQIVGKPKKRTLTIK